MAARLAWRAEQPQWDPQHLVFIDETALNTKMARPYERSSVGRLCLGRVPHGHWQTSTFIAALRCHGIEASFLIEGAANREVFVTMWLKCSALSCAGDVVVFDNLCIPGRKTDRGARSDRALFACLQPGSQPIEQAFAKLKAHLRSSAARTLADLHTATASALLTFTPAHCAALFRHTRYGIN